MSEAVVSQDPAVRGMQQRALRKAKGARRSQTRFGRFSPLFRYASVLLRFTPHQLGLMATAALMLGIGLYGAVLGGHVTRLKQNGLELIGSGVRGLGFRVQEVKVTGAQKLTVPELFERIGLNQPTVTTLGFDVEQARLRLVDIPWIKSASVRILFPGTVDVALVEREPFALWQRGGRINLVDREGDIIGPYEDERFSNLPVVVGDGAEKRLVEIRQLLETYPDLSQRVRAAVLVAGRRWTLKLADGVDVMLPEDGAKEALSALARIEEQSELLKRDIAAFDLRIANRVVVRLTDRAAQIRSDILRARARPSNPHSAPSLAKPVARAI